MAPPKMYRKMSRNNPARTGGMTSSCGVRANCKRVRRAIWAVVVRKLALASEEGAGVMRSVAEVRVVIKAPTVRRRQPLGSRRSAAATGSADEIGRAHV